MRTLTAKFNSICAETGEKLKKGDLIIYDPTTKKAYSINSSKAKQAQEEAESKSVNDYIQAQEDAFFNHY